VRRKAGKERSELDTIEIRGMLAMMLKFAEGQERWLFRGRSGEGREGMKLTKAWEETDTSMDRGR
jgi:hypothetical protein